MMKIYFLFFCIFFCHPFVSGQVFQRNIRTEEYKSLQAAKCAGWNTWYNNSLLSHVLLPQSFAINLCLTNPNSADYLNDVFKASDVLKRPEKVMPGLRSDDGSYTSLVLKYKGEDFMIQSAADGLDELILVTPLKPSSAYLVVEAGLLWGRSGSVGMDHQQLFGEFPGGKIIVNFTADPVQHAYAGTTAPRLTFTLKNDIGISTGKVRSLMEIKNTIARHRAEQQARIDGYGTLAESFKAMQTILAWNTIYDAPNNRVITPVSRLWNQRWGGYVLFDWDTYFASDMLAMFNKELAYANAVEITKSITHTGFVPNYQSMARGSSLDRSQPPIGSSIILNIYKRYHEKWLLEEVYQELLTWNRWWPKNRDEKGFLAWGSHTTHDSLIRSRTGSYQQEAKYESGLDNSPMYDAVPFNLETHTLELADVGLMSMYVMDCNALAEIAAQLGKNADARELKTRSAAYGSKLSLLWDDQTGIYLNQRLDNGDKSHRLSPTNFYPMLAGVCTEAQVQRMIKDHFFNPNEFYGDFIMPSIARNDPAFKDNNYWRGRIWGPMNYLVYMGMRNYNLKDARAAMINKSKALLMKNWAEDGGVFENYNAVTGKGADVVNADGFYHWGALLTYMEFIENGLAHQK